MILDEKACGKEKCPRHFGMIFCVEDEIVFYVFAIFTGKTGELNYI